MKKRHYSRISTLVCSILTIFLMFGCKDELRRCVSDEAHQALLNKDSTIGIREREIEKSIENHYKLFQNQNGEEGLRGGHIIIPVVVHVLYNNSTSDPTNVPDAKINEQLDRLNTDFRKLNTDASSVPSAFAGVAADSRIEFQLAKRDPNCLATTGITRNLVTKTQFDYPSNEAKFTSSGGLDAWDTKKYLNVWVVPRICDGSGCGYLGYSSFPADPPNTYGFVVAYNYLGNSARPFDLGRTAVHEFGHFFNLRHIWGDRGQCGATDFIADTPPQQGGTNPIAVGANFGRPTYPFQPNTCTRPDGIGGASVTNTNGDMFMNYMDYTDDRAMFMFTQGQVDRMVATLYTTMSDLLSSDALIPPPAVSSADLYIQDTPEDIGNEPNNESDNFYISPDIWVRNTNDGAMNREHQNAVFRPSGPNFVYVRVRNRGCYASTSSNVTLYWAKASSGLSWPDPWTGAVSIAGASMGGMIGTQPTSVIAGASSTILVFPWSPPNPNDYSSFGADKAHFCLLARILPPAITETTSLWDNVKNNNNIAWKNIEVTSSGGPREAVMLMANYNKEIKTSSLKFEIPKKEESVFSYGQVFAKLPINVFEKWKANGGKGNNIKIQQDSTIQLLEPNATIENIPLSYKEFIPLKVSFRQDEKRKLGSHVYFIDVNQYSPTINEKNIVGGQRILLKSWNLK